MEKSFAAKLSVLSAAVLLSGCVSGTRHAQQPASNAGARSEVLVKTDSSWDGARLPRYPKGTPEVTIMRIVIPAGQRLPVHQHPVINAGVLLQGELTVRTEHGKVKRLKAGDALVEVVETWHYGMNEGKVPAEIFVVYAGVKGTPVTRLKE